MKTTSITQIGLVLMSLVPATLKAQNLFLTMGNTVVEYNSSGNLVSMDLFAVSSPAGGIAYSGGNLFVSYGSGAHGGSGVAEYSTSGTPVNATLISGLTGTMGGLAISGGDIFLANYTAGTIGEYDLNGNPINASLITGLDHPVAIAISSDDIYVVNANGSSSSVGEYDLSGTPVNGSLITGLGIPITSPEVGGIAISGNDLFVANTINNSIGEYDLSGTPINTSLITDGANPSAMTVNGNDLYDIVLNGFVNEYTTAGADVAHPLLGNGPSGQYTGIAVGPVPEPSTMALLLAGAGACWVRCRRKAQGGIKN